MGWRGCSPRSSSGPCSGSASKDGNGCLRAPRSSASTTKLGRPVRPHGDTAVATPAVLLRAEEADMSTGTRNRVMKWTGTAVPFKPEKRDLKEATRRVGAILDGGGVLAIAGEGRIHAGEGELLELQRWNRLLRSAVRVPVVPVAIDGTSWLVFGRRMRVRIGEPIAAHGRPTREAIDALTRRTWTAPARPGRRLPGPAAPASGQPLVPPDRGLQRVGGGRPTGRSTGRAAGPRSADRALNLRSFRGDRTRRGGPVGDAGLAATQPNTGRGSPRRRMPRSTPGQAS